MRSRRIAPRSSPIWRPTGHSTGGRSSPAPPPIGGSLPPTPSPSSPGEWRSARSTSTQRCATTSNDDNVENAIILADLAALAIDQGGGTSAIEGVEASAESAETWAYPAVVHNASGMISEQLHIGPDEALLRLRASAFVMERSVADLARDVVARKIRLESWTDHG